MLPAQWFYLEPCAAPQDPAFRTRQDVEERRKQSLFFLSASVDLCSVIRRHILAAMDQGSGAYPVRRAGIRRSTPRLDADWPDGSMRLTVSCRQPTMNTTHKTLLAFAALAMLLAPLGAQAQKYIWSPTGADKAPGGTNNMIPFTSTSATYQQIHDGLDFGVLPVQVKGMGMRNYGARTVPGRSWDMRITLSHTKVTAATATGTFTTNLGTTNTQIVYGSATTFATFSWKTFTSTGTVNPPSFTIPFNSPYSYVPPAGNLCWEWRFKNASSIASMGMDAVAGSYQQGSVLASVGTGCVVKGNPSPATARISMPRVNSLYQFRAALSYATKSSPAVMALGLTKKTQNLGFCTALELVPAILLFGTTDGGGAWAFQGPLSALQGIRPTDFFVQFGFNDPTLGLGLSNLAGYRSPAIPGGHGVSRIYKAKHQGTFNGDELATTTTTKSVSYGLVVGWLQ